MPRSKKHPEQTRALDLELPITDGHIGFGHLTLEGFICKEHGRPKADIDRIEFEGTDIKPVLELYHATSEIKHIANDYAKQMLSNNHMQVL